MTTLQWIMVLASLGILMVIVFIIAEEKVYPGRLLLIVVAAGAWYAYKEYSRTNADLAGVKAGLYIGCTPAC